MLTKQTAGQSTAARPSILNKTSAAQFLMRSKSVQTAKTEAPAGGEALEGSEHMMTRIIIPESHQSWPQSAASCTNPAVLAPKHLEDLPSDPKARDCNAVFPGGERMSSHPAHTTAGLKALALDPSD